MLTWDASGSIATLGARPRYFLRKADLSRMSALKTKAEDSTHAGTYCSTSSATGMYCNVLSQDLSSGQPTRSSSTLNNELQDGFVLVQHD